MSFVGGFCVCSVSGFGFGFGFGSGSGSGSGSDSDSDSDSVLVSPSRSVEWMRSYVCNLVDIAPKNKTKGQFDFCRFARRQGGGCASLSTPDNHAPTSTRAE